MTSLPKPRGPLTEALVAALTSGRVEPLDGTAEPEDAALALWVLYELCYRGYAEVDDRLETDPELMRLRRALEDDLESRLRGRWSGPPSYDRDTGELADALLAMAESHDGPSLARHLHADATADQAIELLKCRSLYHLRESDPFSFVLARLPVGARAALAELQYDEYGDGRPERLHAQLFADGLAAAGLDPAEGAYVDQAPLEVLEQNNAMSLFALNRRLRGAAMGHLAAFEATSSQPCRRIAQGLERLGFPEATRAYYEEHVEADAVHEQIAARSICAALVAAEPQTEADVWFGAFTCLDTEDRVARHLLERWGVTP